MTTQQEQLLAELRGLKDQIEKGHYLNVHFRAFQLAHAAWQEHIRQNAVSGARGGHVAGSSPAGAVLDACLSGCHPKEVQVLTADNITDKQIRDLRMSVNGNEDLRRLATTALNAYDDFTATEEHEARKRCAEILNERSLNRAGR